MLSYMLVLSVMTGSGSHDQAEAFIKSLRLSKAKVCSAVSRLKFKRATPPACEKGKKISKVVGRDCHTHYTIVGTICYCNDGTTHSEQIALDAGAHTMANLAFPCKSTCYRNMIRELQDFSGKIHITYKETRGDNALQIHKDLTAYCAAPEPSPATTKKKKKKGR